MLSWEGRQGTLVQCSGIAPSVYPVFFLHAYLPQKRHPCSQTLVEMIRVEAVVTELTVQGLGSVFESQGGVGFR